MRVLLVLIAACRPGSVAFEGAVESGDPGDPPAETDPTVPGEPPPDTTPTTEPPAPAEDYRVVGPHTVEIRNETAELASCEMPYTVYRPNGIEPAALVILAHGWVREKEFMAGWAEHWATWGLVVVTPDLCHAELFDTDHEQNALDLLALQAVVAQGTPVLWAGHSAGGLATLVAAAGDPTALGHLGLDLVDSDGLGAAVAPNLTVPAALLAGEPTTCNEDQNALDVYAAVPDTDALLLVGSDHCDFESPTDWGCTSFCWGESGDDTAIRTAITGLSTAWLLWRSGIAPGAAEWWTPGDTFYEELLTAGAIARP